MNAQSTNGALSLCEAIMANEKVAENFFYRTLAPMNIGFAQQLYRTYKVCVNPDDVATTVYAEVYNEGKWSRLKNFKGDCSLYSWIARIAGQIVYKNLEHLGICRREKRLTASNTYLTLHSMKFKDEVQAVVDLVEDRNQHAVLEDYYVKRISKEDSMKALGMSEAVYDKTLDVAQFSLKDQLLEIRDYFWVRSYIGKKPIVVNLVSLAISDRSGYLHTDSSDEAIRSAYRIITDTCLYEELKEILEEHYPHRPFKAMWYSFVMDRAAEMDWNNLEKTVFYERFCERTSPVILAQRLGRLRSNIDNIYSKTRKSLIEYIREWLAKNS